MTRTVTTTGESSVAKPVPIQRRLFTVNETAAILGVTPHSVRRMIREGRLASLKVGPHRLVTRGALRTHLLEAWANPETRPYVEELLAKPVPTAKG